MKISVVTVCLNSEKTIPYTLNSVIEQNYNNLEHIIVDGGSTDRTKKILKLYPFTNKKIFNLKKRGLYNALNFGIKKATGDVIGILNSDDIFNSNNTIKLIAASIKKNKKFKIFLGDVVFFNKNFSNITRYYPASDFKNTLLKYGMMPPHPACFIKKEIYEKYGVYNKDFKIASDFEIFLRFFYIHKQKFKKIKILVTRMKTGGISGKNVYAYILSTLEIFKSFKINNMKNSFVSVLIRIPYKIKQFFFYDKIKLNKDHNFIYSSFLKKILPADFRIIKDIKKLNLNKNFILSALNLAFLGSYIKKDIEKNEVMINWPDGYFSKTFDIDLKKTPGRDLIRNLRLTRNIKKIIVFGNLSKNSLSYLKKLYNLPVDHRPLGYGNFKNIVNNVNTIIKKNQLIFITLPTPKQEIFANFLVSKNKNFKIICIGGSIAIASGEEKEVPKIIFYFEFLWRLRYETLRRLKRLLSTFYYYSYGSLFTKKIKNLKIEYI
jgi:glycosyltransferase involved in cell wall biosynthesis